MRDEIPIPSKGHMPQNESQTLIYFKCLRFLVKHSLDPILHFCHASSKISSGEIINSWVTLYMMGSINMRPVCFEFSYQIRIVMFQKFLRVTYGDFRFAVSCHSMPVYFTSGLESFMTLQHLIGHL